MRRSAAFAAFAAGVLALTLASCGVEPPENGVAVRDAVALVPTSSARDSTAPTGPPAAVTTSVVAADTASEVATSTDGTTPSDATTLPDTATSSGGTTSTVASLAPVAGGLAVTFTSLGAFTEPIALAARPGTTDGSFYLAERDGTIHRVGPQGGSGQVVADLGDRTSPGGERGLLGLAFAPDGNHLYVNYTDPSGNTHVDELPVDGDGLIDTCERRKVIKISQPYPNHNGGHLAFGPDGMLYVGMGDGGSAGDPDRRALDTSERLGKLLRIDPQPSSDGKDYTVPADNPYVAVKGAKPEIWSIGLRNPWRFSFDRLTGDLWIGDVGQDKWEEVDMVTAASGGGRGVSFGWSAMEGNHPFNDDQPANGHIPPVWEYAHGDDGCSITGGYVYRGTEIPGLYGAYVFGDYCSGKVWVAVPAAPGEPIAGVTELGVVKNLASFGEDATGELYALSLDGGVSRLDPA